MARVSHRKFPRLVFAQMRVATCGRFVACFVQFLLETSVSFAFYKHIALVIACIRLESKGIGLWFVRDVKF
jgi:hypothetical protein